MSDLPKVGQRIHLATGYAHSSWSGLVLAVFPDEGLCSEGVIFYKFWRASRRSWGYDTVHGYSWREWIKRDTGRPMYGIGSLPKQGR